MILDEDEIVIKQNKEYESYLRMIHYWGYIILLGGIAFSISVIFIYSKTFNAFPYFPSVNWDAKYLSLIPLSIMPFAAIFSGWKLIQSQKYPNFQSKGFFWLKVFWGMAILTLLIFFITN